MSPQAEVLQALDQAEVLAAEAHQEFEAHKDELIAGFPTIAEGLIVESDRMATIELAQVREKAIKVGAIPVSQEGNVVYAHHQEKVLQAA